MVAKDFAKINQENARNVEYVEWRLHESFISSIKSYEKYYSLPQYDCFRSLKRIVSTNFVAENVNITRLQHQQYSQRYNFVQIAHDWNTEKAEIQRSVIADQVEFE